MTVTTAKWRLDQYHQIVDAGILDDQPVELLNGEIIEMPPEGLEHAQLSTDAADYLRSRLGAQAIVRDGKPITLPDSNSEPQPDLTIAAPLRQVYRTEHHPYPENIFWVVEYANTSLAKDLDAKRRAYARAEIREYWVVNLKARSLTVLRDPSQGDYQSEQTMTAGDIYPVAFPEIAIAVRRLLEG
jgi:Uma2 family endonuclease